MEKQQATGVLLLFMIFAAWWYVTAPSQAELERQQRIQDSIAQVEDLEQQGRFNTPSDITQNAVVDSAQIKANFGSFTEISNGTEEIVTLENDKLILKLSSKGGYIKEATLKEHLKVLTDEENVETKVPLKLLEDEKNRFEYFLPVGGGKTLSSMNMFFDVQQQGNTVRFVGSGASGQQFTQEYTLPDGTYNVDYNITTQGIAATDNKGIKLKWVNYLDKLEKNVNFEKYYSSIYYKENDEKSDYCSCGGDDEENLEYAKLDWVSHVNQFFNTSLMAENGFYGTEMTVEMKDDKGDDLKLAESTMYIPVQNGQAYAMDMYIGPNEFETLKAYDNGLDEVIPFGRSIFGSINRWIIRPSFNFLSKFIGSKGVVIIVLIFILKMLLYPLMYKMLYSQAKMSALKPVIEKNKAKFKDDAQKAQMETMKTYREYGVNPMGGCMPMVIQMPIWYALFRFFPASITFRQESFLWANDLSSYDTIFNLPFTIPAFGSHISLFTILWAVSTLIYTYYNTKHMDMSANPAMKYVQYFMPIMFLAFFNTYASGLTCYMFFSNLFNIMQTVITKKFVFDDEKIRKELDINKAKPKKKGGFQSRLEEAMKKQQEVQAERAKQQKKKK